MKTFKDFLTEPKEDTPVNEAGRLDIDIKDGVANGLSLDYEEKFKDAPTLSLRVRSKFGGDPTLEITSSSGKFESGVAAVKWANRIMDVEKLAAKVLRIQKSTPLEDVVKITNNLKSELSSLGIKLFID